MRQPATQPSAAQYPGLPETPTERRLRGVIRRNTQRSPCLQLAAARHTRQAELGALCLLCRSHDCVGVPGSDPRQLSTALPRSKQSIMPALHRALALLLASMHALAYEPLTRRRIAGLAAATTLAPRVARADEPAVDAEMLANIQKSRDAWKTNAARRGFAFEPGASMPFVKEGTVGAPDRSAPAHKFRDA